MNLSAVDNHLKGHLVGFGIGNPKTNEINYHWLEKPISNRIVSGGLDFLLTLGQYVSTSRSDNGSAPGIYPWTSTGNGQSGAMAYCAYGDGTGATNFTDTALQNQTSDFTSTLKTGSPFCGTKITSQSPFTYSMRVSHQFPSVEADTVVKEIGWFGKHTSLGTTVMFSRVSLPSADYITIPAGQFLIVTYELAVTKQLLHNEAIKFFDLKDTNGNDLYAKAQLYHPWNSGALTGYVSDAVNEYTIGTNGGNSIKAVYGNAYPAYYILKHSSVTSFSMDDVFCYSNVSREFPTPGVEEASSALTRFTVSVTSSTSAPMVTHTPYENSDILAPRYRDFKVTFPIYCPNLGTEGSYIDFYYIRYRGIDYKFGYDDNGTWVDQCLRKYWNQELIFTFRYQYSTEDTTH